MELADLKTLISQAQKGVPDAWDALVDLYARRVFGFICWQTGTRKGAEDLMQEVFVRAVRMLPKYAHRDSFEAWLFRIATNLIRDEARKRKRRPQMLSLAAPDEDNGDDFDIPTNSGQPDLPEDHPEQQRDRIQWALAQLPDAEREVIVLRHFSEMSFAEIAEMMETPIGTALARAHRGLAKLRELLKDDQQGE